MERLIIPAVFGLIVLIAVAASTSSRRYEAQWKAAAERLQLGYRAGHLFSRPKLSGEVGGLAVRIDVSSSSSSSSNSVRTRYRIGYPPLGLGLRMSRETGLGKAAALFGMSDTKIGDAEFDNAFSIKTSDPDRLSSRLSSTTRRTLLDLVGDYRSVKITDEQLSYEKSGIEKNAGALATTAQRLMAAAQMLQGASTGPQRPAPTSLPVRRPIPPPPRILPPDPFKVGQLPEPIPRRAVPPEPVRVAPETVAAGPGLGSGTAEDIATALFSKKGLSFQIARRFEEQYQGRKVTWPGEVRSVLSGIGPNDPTRVTLLIATTRHELFGSVDVEATASISGRPPGGLALGSQVTVQGTLTGIDAMSRRLIIEDAHVRVET